MPWFKGQSYTGFKGVDLKGSTYIRLHGDATGTAGTLTFDSDDGADRAWKFPAKSGTFPISGTAVCSLPAFGKGTMYSTAITVTGITAEDGVTVTMAEAASSTARVLVSAVAGAGIITLRFANLTASDTSTEYFTVAYTAVR